MLNILLIVFWLIFLIYGAGNLVKWAASLSVGMWVPQIVVGLTVVAFWTSTPELLVNILSAYKWSTDIAIGNIVGSNLGNILLILWTTLLLSDIPVKKNTTWKEIPFAILSSLLLYIMASDIVLNKETSNMLSSSESLVLLCIFCIFLYYIFAISFSNIEQTQWEKIEVYSIKKSILYSVFWLILLFIWWKILVEWAVNIARVLGVSEMLIGLTIVAIGTSLPEFVTSIVAVRKKQTDMVIGNIIGSNIFNVFWILWITGVFGAVPISKEAYIDIQFLLVCSLMVFLFLFLSKDLYRTKNWFHSDVYILKRWQWGILVITYMVYVTYLINRG